MEVHSKPYLRMVLKAETAPFPIYLPPPLELVSGVIWSQLGTSQFITVLRWFSSCAPQFLYKTELEAHYL